MVNKVYAILYDPPSASFVLGLKATINISNQAGGALIFAGGHPAILGGTVNQNATILGTLQQEVLDESGTRLHLQGTGQVGSPFFCTSIRERYPNGATRDVYYRIYVIESAGPLSWAGQPGQNQMRLPTSTRDQCEMVSTRRYQLALFNPNDSDAQVAATLNQGMQPQTFNPPATQQQDTDFLHSVTVQAIAAFTRFYS